MLISALGWALGGLRAYTGGGVRAHGACPPPVYGCARASRWRFGASRGVSFDIARAPARPSPLPPRIASVTGRLLAALLAAVLAAPARAQQGAVPPDSGPRRLDSVVVTSGAAPVVVGGASAVVVRPDSLALPLPPGAPLDRVLRQVPFLLLRQNSRGEAELSVRGSDSRQAAVLLDGLPLTLGWDHRSDPSLLPATGLQAVRVVRGLST
ncbi:MAG: hypothetical protein AVDCRST_MAG11-1131, partial [uncultured Gemmatimonadaceae bacterium]